MSVLNEEVQHHLTKHGETIAEDQATGAVRHLSQQEIQAVAGGPEGTVGTGMNPP